MTRLQRIKDDLANGKEITRDDALYLVSAHDTLALRQRQLSAVRAVARDEEIGATCTAQGVQTAVLNAIRNTF